MKRILKKVLERTNYLDGSNLILCELPSQARINHFAIQDQKLCVWYEHDMGDTVLVDHEFRIVGTGDEYPDEYHHLATVFDRAVVWHILLRTAP